MQVAHRFGEGTNDKSLKFKDFSASVLYLLAAPSTPDAIITQVETGEVPANLEAIKEAKRALLASEEKAKRLEEEARLTLARANEVEQKAKDATAVAVSDELQGGI
jgi:predicted ribosome quality control (RQC) complex YloA/Tae2 family protein